MRLSDLFAAIGPYLEGRRGVGEARKLLYGDGGGTDAERIAIYGRFCQIHRSEALTGTYEQVRAEVEARGGAELWEKLHEAYFAARPMHHTELLTNGESLGEFLGLGDDAAKGWAAQSGLPEWLGALADFEWWEWRTRVAPDDPADEDLASGPLRLASTVEVRPYRWDLVEWIDDVYETDRPAAPRTRDVYVMFWRDPELDVRREDASVLELLALKAVIEGTAGTPPPAVPARSWAETIDDLREAGVILGGQTG